MITSLWFLDCLTDFAGFRFLVLFPFLSFQHFTRGSQAQDHAQAKQGSVSTIFANGCSFFKTPFQVQLYVQFMIG